MDIEVIRSYLKKSPSLLEDIKNIMDYRNLRTEQVYYAKLLYEYRYQYSMTRVCKTVEHAREFEKSCWEMKTVDLDKARRGKHNKALISFARIVNSGKKFCLPEIYQGKLLDDEEIYRHDGNLLVREQMTDAMLDMLFTIENAVCMGEQREKKEHDEIRGLQRDILRFNDQYHVSKSMRKDESDLKDGGIVFDRDLATIFDSFFEN